jgi:hypothetical protein
VSTDTLSELDRAGSQPDSPLARARVHRQLTTEEAARRAGLPEEQVRWLEEGRVYRFPSQDAALTATLLYASALGIHHREALELAGRPLPPLPLRRRPWLRLGVLAAVVVIAAGIVGAVLLSGEETKPTAAPVAAAAKPSLPALWTIHVDVLNGSGDINATRHLADRIGALGYRIRHVGRAGRFDYLQTIVFYEPGGQALGVRLAKTIGAVVRPLPGGHDPRRLLVIAGPAKLLDG